MNNLYLVGTVHTDPDGMYRLDLLLKELAPRRIFVEISEDRAKPILSDSLDKRIKEHEDTIERWEAQGFVLTSEQREKLLELARFKNGSHGFEVRSPFEYKKRNLSTDIYYVDIADEEIVRGVNEALSKSQEPTPEVRKKIIRGLEYSMEGHVRDLRGLVDFQYREAHRLAALSDSIGEDDSFFERELSGLSPQAKESFRRVFDPQRNEFMAERIRKNHDPESVSTAMMGATHLYMVGYLLSDLKPHYILLNQVPVPDGQKSTLP